MEILGFKLPTDNFYFLLSAISFIVLVAFAIYQAVVWTIFPYSVFGIKPLLRKVIEQQQRIEKMLRESAAAAAAKSDVGAEEEKKWR